MVHVFKSHNEEADAGRYLYGHAQPDLHCEYQYKEAYTECTVLKKSIKLNAFSIFSYQIKAN